MNLDTILNLYAAATRSGEELDADLWYSEALVRGATPEQIDAYAAADAAYYVPATEAAA